MNIVHYDVIITRLVPFVNSFTKINHCYKKVPCFRTREIKINIHYPKESGNAPSDEHLYAPVWRRKLLIAVIAKCPRAKPIDRVNARCFGGVLCEAQNRPALMAGRAKTMPAMSARQARRAQTSAIALNKKDPC